MASGTGRAWRMAATVCREGGRALSRRRPPWLKHRPRAASEARTPHGYRRFGGAWYPSEFMDESERAHLERDIHAACLKEDYSAAATVAIEGYGPELLGFLMAVHAQEADASDAFSQLTEALWLGLPGFAWQSSFRTWAYAIARSVMRTNRRNAGRRERRAPRVGDSALADVAAKVRTETITFLKTEKRTRLQALRDALSEDDRMLLVLRVDRKLPWNELVWVLAETERVAPPDPDGIARDAARLRKRFQVVKDRLRQLARQEGLIE